LAAAIGRHPELELATQNLSITTFRYVPADLKNRLGEDLIENHLDRLNQQLVDRVQREGEAFVSNAIIHGRYMLHACIVNFHTDIPDIEALPEIVVRLGKTLDRLLRPSMLRGQNSADSSQAG